MNSSRTGNDGTGGASGGDPSVARELIKQENELMNHRITWFITLQGLLFAALAFAWDKNDAQGLIFVLCSLAMLVAVSTAFILWGCAAAIEQLHREHPRAAMVIGRRASWIEKIAYPWYAFPVLFFVAWGLIFYLNHSRSA